VGIMLQLHPCLSYSLLPNLRCAGKIGINQLRIIILVIAMVSKVKSKSEPLFINKFVLVDCIAET